MKVLVACEESQRVCTAFRERGHVAYSCDVQEPSGGHPEWHILVDVLTVLEPDPDTGCIVFDTMAGGTHMVRRWDLIIAHPPCTYLSNVGARHLWKGGQLNTERYAKGMDARAFFMRFYNADCEHICIENPVPSRIYDLPKYTQIIQPYQHGHPVTKKTCLWLKGLPPLVPTEIVEPIKGRKYIRKDGTARWVCWEMEQRGGKARAKERSKTFPGIARAMAEQWGGIV